MEMAPPLAPTKPDESPSLTRNEVIALVAAMVVLFAFVSGPIWRHPWEPNASILYSYAPIPVLVALVLLRGKRLTFGAWALGTLQVAVAKFVITAFVLVGLWAATNPEAKRDAQSSSIAPPSPSAATPITVVPNGAVVPPARPAVDLAFGPENPARIDLAVGAPLQLHSSDGHMHTFVAPQLSLNLPVVPGATRSVVFAEPVGEIDVACAVHPKEPHVKLVVSR